MKRVVSLFDRSGVMLKPWAEAGYQCVAVDLQNGLTRGSRSVGRSGIVYFCEDVNSLPANFCEGAVVAFAFPPCTHLAGSGARWWVDKGDAALSDALALVSSSWELISRADSWALENPVGRLSSAWRPPEFMFDPCDYAGYEGGEGDTYTKRTCLWTGGAFVMPEAKRLEPVDGSRMWARHGGKGHKTKNARSVTPRGFARAVFEANHR